MRGKQVQSYCPWLIAHSDVNPVGDPEAQRHLQGETQLCLVVRGQFDAALVLGMVAMRCSRQNGEWVPESICLPDVPPVVPERSTGMDMTLLSGPTRHAFDKDGTWR